MRFSGRAERSPRRLPALVGIIALTYASLALLSGRGSASGFTWQETFGEGTGGAVPYHRDEPRSGIQWIKDASETGGGYLRVTLADKRLAGCRITAGGLSGDRFARVSARVRGKGEIWLNLSSRSGWLRYPRPVALTDEWQEITLTKGLARGEDRLSIYFIARDMPSGWVYEIDEISVALEDVPETEDSEAGPWRINAEDFSHAYVNADDGALSGKAVARNRFFRISGIPFPATSREVSVYIRVKPGNVEENYRIVTRARGVTQVLRTISPDETGRWQWMEFPPVTAGEVGESFNVDVWARAGGSAVDCFVISTEAGMGTEELGNAPELFRHRPLAAVGKAEEAPVLDGELGDEAWRGAVVLSGFRRTRTSSPAEADTAVRISYDSDNLYISFMCEEPVLETAAQIGHEFRDRITERGGQVWRDDSVFIMLKPEGGRRYYDYFINSSGVINDAVCIAPNLWETRDDSWNSRAAARGMTGDGYWALEAAFPFSDFGREKPGKGEVWKIALGRSAISRQEQSSWNLSGAGFHSPGEMGAIMFADEVPGIAFGFPERFESGVNVVRADVHPSSGKRDLLYLASSVKTRESLSHDYMSVRVKDAAVSARKEISAGEEEELSLSMNVLGSGDLRPVYLGPWRQFGVASHAAGIRLGAESPYRLFHNGRVIASGQGGADEEVKLFLQKGENVIALEVDGGAAMLEINAPGIEPGIIRWRLGRPGLEAVNPSTDDRNWDIAPSSVCRDSGRRMFGTPGSPAVLRHTLLWEETRIWPAQEPALHIPEGSSQLVNVTMLGLQGKRLDNWKLCFGMPEQFEISGVTGYYGHHEHQPSFAVASVEDRVIDGRKFRVYRIEADTPVRSGRHHIMSRVNLMVRAREGYGGAVEEGPVFVYWTEANEGTVVEARQTVPVKLLPPLAGRQPEEFTWLMWGSFFSAMDDENCKRAVLSTMKAAGMNEMMGGGELTSSAGAEYGIKLMRGMNFRGWSINLAPHLERNPDERLIRMDGTADGTRLCTTLMLGEGWQAVEEALERVLQVRADIIDYDYESSPLGDGNHSCYCPRCLSAFREFAELGQDAELNSETVNNVYDELWVDFMAHRVAEIFRKFRNSIHELSPGTKFGVYSGYQTPDNPRRYGVNWEYAGKLRAVDRAGMGYGRPVPAIHDSVRALDGIPALFGVILRPYRLTETWPLVPLTRAVLLRRALDATGGILVYNLQPMDGRSWHAVAEVSRLVAEFEDLFLRGSLRGLGGLDEANVQVVSGGGKTLVAAMNYSGRPIGLRIPMPADRGGGKEFYSGAAVSPGEIVELELEPGGVKVYVFGN